MRVTYSKHLRFKMQQRAIPDSPPERIYRESTQRFYNHHSLRQIAVLEVLYRQHRALMMIAYDQMPEEAEIITIHPITRDQIQDRLRNGRWTHG
jgi:hypothetical protein